MKFIIYLFFALFTLCGSNAFSQSKDTTVTFGVNGLCVQCKQRIEGSLKIKGVRSSKWDVGTKMLTVKYDPEIFSVDQLEKKVAAIGHDTEHEKADDAVYEALDECCLYRGSMMEPTVPDSVLLLHSIRGIIVESSHGKVTPLRGASVFWEGTSQGVVTDDHGEFLLPKKEENGNLVISYAGFKPETVALKGMNDIQITLKKQNDVLSEVVITARPKTTFISGSSPFRTEIMTKKELLKAACCSLSESFETNPSVDVSYSDAVTGSKQIQLLGLAGVYTQLTVEELPGPRGLATPLGLNSIAGPWVESIQLIKGAGSVVNGFESIAGQINVELKKPQTSEKLYLNGYVNDMGKMDLNVNLAHKLNSKWSTGLLLHDDVLFTKKDFNKDGFIDLPTGNLFSAVHRWQFIGDNGIFSQFGVKVLTDRKTGGEMDFNSKSDKLSTNHYGIGFNTNRYEVFGKLGYVFPEKMHKSVGLQVSAFDHDQDAYFGTTLYNGNQKNFYANLIYQSQIGSEKNSFKTGMSFLYDDYAEKLNATPYNRQEIVPGAFLEYTFAPSEKLDVVAGMRADHNSLYGWFATPRLNIRYSPTQQTTLRFSAGRGQRTANIFAENIGIFASSREIEILTSKPGVAYGLGAETAWNKGVSFDQKFHLFGRDASFSMDFYRNDFMNQVVVDLEDPRKVKFYDLGGKSYSNSFQTQVNFIPAAKFEVRLAYRYFDVKTTYSGQLLEKPYTARNRAFVNLAYDLKGFKIDLTTNYVGSKRIPSTAENPEMYRMESRSPAYVTMNAQVSKTLGKKKLVDVYVGGENLTNYFQKNLIISHDDPFGKYFDASMVWGPVSGRLIYGGFRFTIK